MKTAAPSQTKLFKLVCKRAALMTEPYRKSLCATNRLKQQTEKESTTCRTIQVYQISSKIKGIVYKKPSSISKVCTHEQYNFSTCKSHSSEWYDFISFFCREHHCRIQPTIPSTKRILR